MLSVNACWTRRACGWSTCTRHAGAALLHRIYFACKWYSVAHQRTTFQRAPAHQREYAVLLQRAPCLQMCQSGTGLEVQNSSCLCRVASLAGSISLQAALVFISSLVSLAFAGHLGRLALSQAVLATSCC